MKIVLVLFLGAAIAFTVASTASGQKATIVKRIGAIVVDVQGDFTEWKKGSLAVSGTNKVFIEKVRNATKLLKKAGFIPFATQDWHPGDHISFYTNHPGKKPFEVIKVDDRTQVLWPPHCVQGTENARILVDNNLFLAIVQKGRDKRFDSYSGFQDDGGQKTEMDSILRRNGIEKVVVYGIATDYCVKATAIDAAKAGYEVIVIKELCRGVAPDTSKKALVEMKRAGVIILDKLDIDKIKKL
ncbi:MAG: isochorismatase family protein [Deltaproteobacteria bacterium]|nr:isochorismatase family protein [Deltaproteobacteria bacterium]